MEIQMVPMIDLLLYDMGLSKSAEAFTSRRPGWPYNDTVLLFPVSGGIVVEDGIPKVLLCKDHPKQQLRKKVRFDFALKMQLQQDSDMFSFQFVHVPHHPVLKSTPLHPDILAPATVQPNVVRAPRMGKWTNSSHVINEFGGGSGLSSFHVSPVLDSAPLNITIEENEANHKLVFERRPDIRDSYSFRWSENYVQENLAFGASLPQECVKEKANLCTYIPGLDAFRNWQRFQNRHDSDTEARAVVGTMSDYNDEKIVKLKMLNVPSGLSPLLVTAIALQEYCNDWSFIVDSNASPHPLLVVVKDFHKRLRRTQTQTDSKGLRNLRLEFEQKLIRCK
jgi:hypothetical protein